MREDKDTQSPNVNISVENFGPIEKADIDLRPLTIFVGESNTGKTYLATLIYTLNRVFEGFSRVPFPDSIIFLLKQSRFRDKEGLDEETYEMLTKLNTLGRQFTYADIPKWLCSHVFKLLNETDVFANQLKKYYNLESITDIRRFTNNNLSVSLEVEGRNQHFWNFKMQSLGSDTKIEGTVNRGLILKPSQQEVYKKNMDLEDFKSLIRLPKDSQSITYFLPAAKKGIMETHGIITSSLVDRATPGGFDHTTENTMLTVILADFLKHIINYEHHDKSPSEIVEIAKALENEVLRGEIKVSRPAGIGYPQFLYQPLNTEQTLRMSQSSSMVSELAPLVLFLRGIVKPGDTLIIEEPESHLHPRAQTQIAITLARLVRAGVRVIITTHSDWLLQEIGNLIREGELKKQELTTGIPHWLSKEEVGAWWFHTDRPVVEIPFDRIEGIEPRDYEDVADGLYNTFVELERQFLNEEIVTENE